MQEEEHVDLQVSKQNSSQVKKLKNYIKQLKKISLFKKRKQQYENHKPKLNLKKIKK
jgi:hypothetical protein